MGACFLFSGHTYHFVRAKAAREESKGKCFGAARCEHVFVGRMGGEPGVQQSWKCC